MNSYAGVEQEKWDDVEFNMSECEKTYKNIINDFADICDEKRIPGFGQMQNIVAADMGYASCKNAL